MTKMNTRGKNENIRIMIVDDHPVVREGLAQRIEKQADMSVCADTGEFADALKLAADTNPDVAIIDLSLKTGHGLDLIKRLKAHNAALKILVWSMHPESLYAERVLHAGALGYINKENATEQIIEAIRRVRDNKVFLSQVMSERLLRQAPGEPSQRLPLTSLSDRELETFEFLGQGMTTLQIAAKMRLSPKTVETYRARIKLKLNLQKGTELVQRAVQWVLEKR